MNMPWIAESENADTIIIYVIYEIMILARCMPSKT